tara:strand:+ start:4034 stop:4141 length:108 start_codon:yes stop_codon:yes gene_type:complete
MKAPKKSMKKIDLHKEEMWQKFLDQLPLLTLEDPE